MEQVSEDGQRHHSSCVRKNCQKNLKLKSKEDEIFRKRENKKSVLMLKKLKTLQIRLPNKLL